MFMEKIKNHVNERQPAIAYVGSRVIRLAPLSCQAHCGHELPRTGR